MKKQSVHKDSEGVRLNRFIANSGICNRREADELIKKGDISVNGDVVKILGTKVQPGRDRVEYQGKRVSGDSLRYVLINKPKGYGGPRAKGDKTIFSLLNERFSERLIILDELEVDECGLLLVTNDGRLSIAKHGIRTNKSTLYHVVLDKPISEKHLVSLRKGVPTTAGLISAHEVVVTADGDGHAIGLRPGSDETGIVREMLAALGYKTVKNDRVMYAGLTKKDLPRGKWRPLTQKEISFVLMSNK